MMDRTTREVLDQVFEQGIRQPLFVRPLRITEHAIEGFRVGFLNFPHRALERRTDIARLGADVVPVAVLWDLKAVRLRKPGQLLVAGLIDDLLVFLVPDIADALEEQQREDVGLEVSRIHRAAQDVGGFPEVAFELTQGYGTWGIQSELMIIVDVLSLPNSHLVPDTRLPGGRLGLSPEVR